MQNHKKMNEQVPGTGSISVFRNTLRDSVFWARTARQAVAGVLAAALLPMSMGMAFGQYQNAPPPPPPDYGNQDAGPGPDQGGPPPNDYQPLPAQQIDQLVAPISLYPDSLVAQVLAASTYPQQVAAAEQFVQQNGNYAPQQLGQMANAQPWDPSVKALVAFPQVLNDLTQNMSWTTQLGNAYYNQPQDVMNAVQAMRQRAYAAGNLRSSSRLAVDYAPGDIVIAPVNPAVVYVPYYNPWAVYGAPIAVYPHYYWGRPAGVALGVGLGIGFGVGIAVGAFAGFGWGFHAWAPNWRAGAVVYNHNTYISRSTTVINHGHFGGYNGGVYHAHGYNQGGPINHGYNAPRPGTSAYRNGNQQQRIGQGVASGRLNAQQTGNLEQRESSIHNEKSNMRAADGGHLTAQDRRAVNHRQNHVSRSIHKDKH